jgi:hypothetical protein
MRFCFRESIWQYCFPFLGLRSVIYLVLRVSINYGKFQITSLSTPYPWFALTRELTMNAIWEKI